MKSINKKVAIVPIVTFLILLKVYRNIIISPLSLGGDFNFVGYDHFRLYSTWPYSWDISLNNGFGQYTLFTLPFFFYARIANSMTFFIHNPFILHKIIFLIPIIAIGYISIRKLMKAISDNAISREIATVLYLTNPYITMLFSGGQIGVAFAYAFAPYVLATTLIRARRIATEEKMMMHEAIGYALQVSIIVACDARIALIILVMSIPVWIYEVMQSVSKMSAIKKISKITLVSTSIICIFHAYWLLPAIVVQNIQPPKGYTISEAVQFFSFARLAHAITWTHPNFPENKFGVVNEVAGINFIFPLLAFAAIQLKRKIVYYLAASALVAIFLIKGTNPPFGEVYKFFFLHIPAGSWFRDGTKFFVPLSITYSILISLILTTIYKTIAGKYKKIIATIGICIIIGFAWLPIYTNGIEGVLKFRTYPQEFQEVENVLKNDKSFGRVLWVPSREIYGYSNIMHPAVNLKDLITGPQCISQLCRQYPKLEKPELFNRTIVSQEIEIETEWLSNKNAEELLNMMGIKYIIVSPDIDQNIYIYDKKFDSSIREEYISALNNKEFLDKRATKTNVHIWQTKKPPKYIADTDGNAITYTIINPTKIELEWYGEPEKIIVNQAFDEGWEIEVNEKMIKPEKGSIETQLIFDISNTNQKKLVLSFAPQRVTDFSFVITIIGVLSSILVYIASKSQITSKSI